MQKNSGANRDSCTNNRWTEKTLEEDGGLVVVLGGFDFLYFHFILFFYIHLISCNFLIGCF